MDPQGENEAPSHVKSGPGASAAVRLERLAAWVTVALPTLGVVAALTTWNPAHATMCLGVFAAFYAISTLGVTMGYHRYFTHRGFEAGPAVQACLAVAGSMAAQGPLIFWVAAHRRHHQFSDRQGDPHSPVVGDDGPRAGLRGFLHGHVGWMLSHQPEDWRRYAPDLLKSRLWVRLNFAYPWWVALGLAAPALIGGLWTQSAAGALEGFLWGGLARIFAVHHSTWSVNSICHLFGQRPYETRDQSTNNFLVALLAFGEGWHNNHHAFPTSARHGLAPWQLDLTWLALRACEAVGLVRDIQVPSQEQLAAKRVTPGAN